MLSCVGCSAEGRACLSTANSHGLSMQNLTIFFRSFLNGSRAPCKKGPVYGCKPSAGNGTTQIALRAAQDLRPSRRRIKRSARHPLAVWQSLGCAGHHALRPMCTNLGRFTLQLAFQGALRRGGEDLAKGNCSCRVSSQGLPLKN